MTIPSEVGHYLEARRAHREADRNAILAGLTKREQELVRDAAVMGYVQGRMVPRSRSDGSDIPPDGVILASVLDGCLAMSDLYPAVRRAYRRGMRKAGAGARDADFGAATDEMETKAEDAAIAAGRAQGEPGRPSLRGTGG